MDFQELQEHYRDSATSMLDFKTPEGEEITEQITLTHLPIDLPLFEELDAMTQVEGDDVPISARQLARVDARIRDLTRDAAPATFNLDFWLGLHPALRQKFITAVNSNVPREVRYLFALRRLKEQGDKNVEGNEQT
jgi:hypothetical protein